MAFLDYSILLAVEENVECIAEKRCYENESKKFLSTCGKYTYHVAIIDYLTDWNWQKRTESFYKNKILQRNLDLMSAVEPNKYADRFKNFMRNEVFINEEENKQYYSIE
jgi:Na+-transporting NADH:ubiquinone oxidoreductase subunit NqrF